MVSISKPNVEPEQQLFSSDDLALTYAERLAALFALPKSKEQLSAISAAIRVTAATARISVEDAYLKRLAPEAAMARKEGRPLPFPEYAHVEATAGTDLTGQSQANGLPSLTGTSITGGSNRESAPAKTEKENLARVDIPSTKSAVADFRQRGTSLTENDFRNLAASGINRAHADAVVRRVSDSVGREVTGRLDRDLDECFAGQLFTFTWPESPYPRDYILRLDKPPKEQRADGTLKEQRKYLTQQGELHLLFSPDTREEWLTDASIPLIFCEGVKKVLAMGALMFYGLGEAAERPRFLVAGIQGVNGWRGKRGKQDGADGKTETLKGPLNDFGSLALKGRTVTIVYDADVHTNDNVRIARLAFAKMLREQFSVTPPLFADIPLGLGLKGIDDVAGALGPEKALEILACAYNPRAKAGGDRAKANGSAQNDSWPDPEPLGGELPPVPAFDLRLLPEALRTLVQDTSERMQVPCDFPAIASVLCLAGAVGRRAFIRPKAEDSGWIVVPNLWGAIIGPPGIMLKSPVINAIAKPLHRIEKLWRQDYETALAEHEHEKEMAELRLAAWKQQFVAAEKSKKASPIRPDASIAKPVLKRLIVHDASPEKLHEILCENPAGVLMVRDELAGWMSRLDEEGRGGERQFFLTLWNGDTPYSVDRIGRGSLYGEACCMSLLGGIQPSRLRNYLADALYDGPQNDGLFQRLQLMVYPDPIKEWVYTDRLPRSEAIAKASRLYQRLVELDVEQPRLYKFDPLGQELFVDWLTKLEQKLRNAELHPALVCHLSKYRSLMPSLALLFQLADDEPDEGFEGFVGGGGCPLPNNETYLVSLEHAKQAAAFCEYLEANARRVYSMIISPERAAAAEIGRHLTAGWKRAEGTFTLREVYRNDWRRLDTPERVRPALEILKDAGWVRQIESERPTGRPSEVYAINPRLQRQEEE